jgi:hypothetical protein
MFRFFLLDTIYPLQLLFRYTPHLTKVLISDALCKIDFFVIHAIFKSLIMVQVKAWQKDEFILVFIFFQSIRETIDLASASLAFW